MKKIVLMMMLVMSLSAGEMVWKHWDAATQLARKENKIIMIEAVRTGCHYCAQMQQDVFSDSATVSFIQQRFIPVRIDLDHQVLPLKVNVVATPTFFFINKEGKLLKTVQGRWSRDDFKMILEDIR